jgi:hypothetical protein
LAWVAGFVVPGAAAGVGVREAVPIVALDGPLGPEASAVVALAFRLVTTAGEGVFCALAPTLPMRPGSTSAPVAKQTSKNDETNIKVNVNKPQMTPCVYTVY